MANPASVGEALGQIKKRGGLIIFIARLTPFIRGPIYFAAGMARMSILWFIVVDTVAAILQNQRDPTRRKKWAKLRVALGRLLQKIGALMAALLIGGALFGYLRKVRAKEKACQNQS